jgi:hypothetical protein
VFTSIGSTKKLEMRVSKHIGNSSIIIDLAIISTKHKGKVVPAHHKGIW